MLKTKESISSQKLCSCDFWWKANSIFNKFKFTTFYAPEVLSSASHKVNLFAQVFCRNSNADDAGIFLLTFTSRTKLKLHNIFVTLQLD